MVGWNYSNLKPCEKSFLQKSPGSQISIQQRSNPSTCYMRTLKTLILVNTALFALSAQALPPENLVPNGDMETGVAEWSVMNQVFPTKDAHGGGQAMELRAEGKENVRAIITLSHPVPSGIVKLWFRCPDLKSSAANLVVAIIPIDSAGNEIPNGRQSFTVDKPKDDHWHEFKSEFDLPPETKSTSFRLSINESEIADSPKGRTVYHVDDVSVISH